MPQLRTVHTVPLRHCCPLRRLRGLRGDGGPVPGVHVAVLRRLPDVYLDTSAGGMVGRSQRGEELAGARFQARLKLTIAPCFRTHSCLGEWLCVPLLSLHTHDVHVECTLC